MQPLKSHKIILKTFLYNIVILGPKPVKFQMNKMFLIGGNVSKISSALDMVCLLMQQKLIAVISRIFSLSMLYFKS